MFLADYMTANPATILEDAPLATAQSVMQRHSVRHLPVLDAARRLVGIISDRDVRLAVGFDRHLTEKLLVADVMTADPLTVGADATLDEALAILCTRKIGALPVMRGSALLGILTRSDVLRAFHKVLGMDVPGRRLEVALPNGSDDLARAFGSLAPADGAVLSAVVARTRRDGAEPVLYLRVADGAAQDVQRRLHHAAVILLKPEAE
ncbi:MAG: CBS domain-containing protein [Planctomycetes bacterium]|nr:CBS domain-containing protein [Planctomycetota bacterium]